MKPSWQAVGLTLLVLVSLPGAAVATGPAASPGLDGSPTSTDNVSSPEPPEPHPTNHAAPVTVTPTAEGATLPWRGNRLPVFVGDTVTFHIEPDSGYEVINASWETTGPATVSPTTTNGSTATGEFHTRGETTLQATVTVRNVDTNETVDRQSAAYTLIATPQELAVDGFSVSFVESPSRWEKAAINAHLRQLPQLHQNLTQRIPVPSQVEMVYTTRADIQHFRGGAPDLKERTE